jgi:hypothetical protein
VYFRTSSLHYLSATTQRAYSTDKHPLHHTQTPLIKLAGLDEGQHTISRSLFHAAERGQDLRDVFHIGLEAVDCDRPFQFEDKNLLRKAVFQNTGSPSESMAMADRNNEPWHGPLFVSTSQRYLIAEEFAEDFAAHANQQVNYVYEIDARILIAKNQTVIDVNNETGSFYPREHEIAVGHRVPPEAIKCAWKVTLVNGQVLRDDVPIPNPNYKSDCQELEL